VKGILVGFLRDVWSGLIFASQWSVSTIKNHPLISLLVLGCSAYMFYLTVRLKQGDLRKQRRDEQAADREAQVAGCLRQIEDLNLATPGGLKSMVQPSPGEDPQIVREAWERYVAKRRTGDKGRFNRS
jgi:hypothetical protein